MIGTGNGKSAHKCGGDNPAPERTRSENAAGGTGTYLWDTGKRNTGSLATNFIHGSFATPTSPVGAGMYGYGKNAQACIIDFPATGRPEATAAGST